MEIDELIDKLSLVAENILEEAAGQPLLFIEASRYRVARMRGTKKAKAWLDYLESRVALLHRQRARANDDKMTEAAVRERVLTNKKVRLARRALDDAEAHEEFAKLLLDAYRQRRDAVRIIGESQLAEGTREGRELEYIAQKKKMRERARELARRRQQNPEEE